MNQIKYMFSFNLAAIVLAVSGCGMAATPLAEIRTYHGTTTLFVKGKPHMGLVLWAQPMPAYGDKEALHIYTDDIPPWNENPDPNNALANMDNNIQYTIARDRNAHYLIRLGTQAPRWWLKKNPGEKIIFNGKPVNMAAYASVKWRKDAGDAISRQIEHIQSSPYADRVIGFLIAGGNAGEWAIAGDANHPDTSTINKSYFRVWLRKKYNDDVARLRKAWNDPKVTFDTATIPSMAERTRKDRQYFRNPAISGKTIDFYTYWNWLTADTILYFAKIIKAKTNGGVLAGAFYGYNIGSALPADTQRNAHGAAQTLIESPYIDFLAGPFMYFDRQIGGSEMPRTIEDSLRIHNKMWFNEADIRTYPYKSKEGFYIPGVQDSLEVMRRGLAWSIIRGNGIWLGWADNTIKDWLHDFLEIASKVPGTDRGRADEFAFVLDDDVAFYLTTDNYIGITSRCFQIMEAARCGVPYSIYSMKDILSGKAPDHKVYIFMDAYHLTAAQRDSLKKRFRRNSAIAVWEYAPGFATDTSLSIDNIKATTGMNVGLAAETGVPTVHITDYSHPITSDLPGNHVIGGRYVKFTADNTTWNTYVSPRNLAGPVFYINDPSVTVLGKLDIDGSVGLGLKRMDGWTSIYSCAPSISAELMRGICRFAGIHVYSNTRDFLAANNNWLTIHTQGPGERVIALPRKRDVYDVFNKRLVGKGMSEIRFTSTAAETRLYYLDAALPSAKQYMIPRAVAKLRLAVDWNTGFDADSAAGEKKAIVMGTPKLTAAGGGRFGRGVHIARGNDGLGYNDPRNINPKQGTVEFWFRPDWDGKDALKARHNYLFEAVDIANQDHIKILKLDWTGSGDNSLNVQIWSGGRMSAEIDWTGIRDWKKGRWHHIVLTWAPDDYRLYVDKVLVGSGDSGAVPSRPLPTITVGFIPTTGEKQPAGGTFDKLRIYDYPVKTSDVATMYDQKEE